MSEKRKDYQLDTIDGVDINRVKVITNPGMIVGYVGNTGNCSNCSTQAGRDAGNGAHLHVQLVVADSLKDVYNADKRKLEAVNDKSINPFDYTDVYSNPIRETI